MNVEVVRVPGRPLETGFALKLFTAIGRAPGQTRAIPVFRLNVARTIAQRKQFCPGVLLFTLIARTHLVVAFGTIISYLRGLCCQK